MDKLFQSSNFRLEIIHKIYFSNKNRLRIIGKLFQSSDFRLELYIKYILVIKIALGL